MPVQRGRSAGLVAIVVAFFVGNCSSPTAPQSLEDLAQSSLAQLDGSLSVPGLSKPVEVIRDKWGVPHIYAQNTADLFFAQGYVMAQDRLWQMEMWRRWREGRLAEIFGSVGFDYDKRTRLMMYRGPWDAREWTSYHPEGELIFTAYANGVNAYIEQNADNLPLEFRLTGVRPDRWTAQTVALRWASIGLSSVRGHGISELQLAMNVARLGVEEANRRANPDPWDELAIPEGLDVTLITQAVLDAARAGDDDPFAGALPPLEIVEEFRYLVPELRVARVSAWDPMDAGSNNWVMSGDRTPTGVPILANDPHRRIEMPALRYFVHLNAPGWNLIGGGEPPFVGADAGSNEHMAWGFTFAGTDMVDIFVEEVNPDDSNQVRWQNGWAPLRVITEQIAVRGEAPRTVELKFSRNGPVFYEDRENNLAYAVRSVLQEPGTAAYKGSFQLAQAESCKDFFERAMHWLVPTHSLICGDSSGNIALQVSGLTPNRNGWNGRLPVPGSGRYEWRGFREDLPREFNPARGYIGTANNNVHPPDYTGRPVFYHSATGVDVSRIERLHQILGTPDKFSVEDHKRIHHDNLILQGVRDVPLFQGWMSDDANVERARAMVADWDGVLAKESAAAAVYIRWSEAVDAKVRDKATPATDRRALVEAGLQQAIKRLTSEQGADWREWRHGRVNQSELPHMMAPAFGLPPVERGGGFGALNATGANFRRIIDLSNVDNSVATNAPGQSAQPGSPFYDNLRENLGSGEYFPFPLSRERIEQNAAYRLMLEPR